MGSTRQFKNKVSPLPTYDLHSSPDTTNPTPSGSFQEARPLNGNAHFGSSIMKHCQTKPAVSDHFFQCSTPQNDTLQFQRIEIYFRVREDTEINKIHQRLSQVFLILHNSPTHNSLLQNFIIHCWKSLLPSKDISIFHS